MLRKLALLVVLTAGCGARTSLGVEEADGGLDASSDSAASDSAFDTVIPPDTDVPDTIVVEDVPLTEVGCSSDAECDDGVTCTRDVCDPVGLCRNVPVDALCDDRLFCTGDERCDAVRGCFSVPRNCSDPISCTVDRCDEATRSCVRTPNDALCPVSHRCDLMLGCQARAFAHTERDLYEIRLPSGVVNRIGSTTGTLTDVALHPSGTLYGVRFDGLCIVDVKTGSCSSSVTPVSGSPVGLDFAPDGTLFGAAGAAVYTIDRATGATTTVARFPPGMQASGDLAFIGSRLVGTARAGGSADDILVEFNLAAGTSRPLGRTGFNCIWGLAAFGPTLYGLTCEGRVLRIDPLVGSSTQLSRASAEFWGATAR